MKVTLEQVEMLRKKVNCDYQTAEKALRKSKGDINFAILYLKKMENSKYKKMVVVIQEFISKILSYYLLIHKSDKKVLQFPIVFVIIIIGSMSIPLPILLSFGVLAALSEFSFEIIEKKQSIVNEEYPSSKNYTKEKDLEKYKAEQNTSTEDTISEKIKKEIINDCDSDDDGFNEIIIE